MLDSSTLKTMSPEQIKDILSKDIDEESDTSLTPEELIAALEELKAREGTTMSPDDINRAWKEFNENYRPRD